jgi:hypothetical protein
MPVLREAVMISGRACRIYVSDGKSAVPEGYTFRSGLLGLIGLKSSNIHIHLANGWDIADDDKAKERLQMMIVNLSCNCVPPTITIGKFDPRISRMLFAMELLSQ